MDALELLKQDHQKVKELFEQAEEAEGEDQQEDLRADQNRARNPCADRGDRILSGGTRA